MGQNIRSFLALKSFTLAKFDPHYQVNDAELVGAGVCLVKFRAKQRLIFKII
ncbi:MAG TPA: hypothetical protein VMW55_11060 [Nitrosopumilaceae archaeon]|nr:hypothetical protein [Nitrosopumilaceae archaeon]